MTSRRLETKSSTVRRLLTIAFGLVLALLELALTAAPAAAGNAVGPQLITSVSTVGPHDTGTLAGVEVRGPPPRQIAPATSVAAKTAGALRSVDDVMADGGTLLRGKSPSEVESILKDTPGWRVEGLGQGSAQGRGWMMREYTERGNPAGRMIRWHPGGGHHGPDPYWRVVGYEGDLFGIIK